MSDLIERVGIVGFGPMGQLIAEKMLPGMEVIACDPRMSAKQIGSVRITDVNEVAKADVVIMAVPARHLGPAVEAVVKAMDEETLLVDVSSVKVFPDRIFKRLRPSDQSPILLCHPLFGPQSTANGLEGHNLIVTEQSGNKAAELIRLWDDLGLNIVHITADEHDRQMAEVHAKTFILGRLASMVGDTPAQFDPPSHKAVEMLEALDAAHSPELFESIVHFNPYAHEMIEKMLTGLSKIKQPAPEVAAMIAKTTEYSA